MESNVWEPSVLLLLPFIFPSLKFNRSLEMKIFTTKYIKITRPKPPKTSYPIRESRELAKTDGCVLSAPRKIFISL